MCEMPKKHLSNESKREALTCPWSLPVLKHARYDQQVAGQGAGL